MRTSAHEWARRIRAAAAYAGLEHQELARRLGMSDSTLRRHLAADKRPHEIKALCQTVAEITDLPYEFFIVDFNRLAVLTFDQEPEEPDVPAGLVDAVDGLRQVAERHAAQLREIEERLTLFVGDAHGQTLEDFTRQATKQGLVDEGEDDAQATEAAASTRDEADASSGSDPAQSEARPRSERSSGA